MCLLNIVGGGEGAYPICFRPIIPPLIPCPFWEYPSDWSQVLSGGYPSLRHGETQSQVGVHQSQPLAKPVLGTPLPGQDWGTTPPSQGYIPQIGQHWGTYPSTARTGVPFPETEQQSEYLVPTRRAICLLCSRRRTFLFNERLSCSQMTLDEVQSYRTK